MGAGALNLDPHSPMLCTLPSELPSWPLLIFFEKEFFTLSPDCSRSLLYLKSWGDKSLSQYPVYKLFNCRVREKSEKKNLKEFIQQEQKRVSLKLFKLDVVASLQRQQGDQVQVFKFSLDDIVKVPPTTTK